MRGVLKMVGGFLILSLLVAHLLMVSLFLAPAPKLLGLVIGNEAGFIGDTDIPDSVQSFITKNKIQVTGDYGFAEKPFQKLLLGILKVRRDRIMDPTQQLALDMNLLNFGKNVVGLKRAALFYYKKPLTQLADPEWVTLINLQKIFSKK
jgi:hypothetical protein